MINDETIFIISGILGIWTWIFKVFVVDALQKSIDNLTAAIKETSNQVHVIDATLSEHGAMLDSIDRRVAVLEKDKNA